MGLDLPWCTDLLRHGFLVYYDLDWISVRAGWVLENVTFQNFGFSDVLINHDALLGAVIAGKADQPLENVVSLKKDKDQQKSRTTAAERATAWWKLNGPTWNRRDAIVEALKSQDPVRVSRTLDFVRNGGTRCEGFNRDFVESKVLPILATYTSPEMHRFSGWTLDTEEERKGISFYNAKNQDACY